MNFISKYYTESELATGFGGTLSEYQKWSPHICGICCLKMVGDTLGVTNHISLYELTLECCDLGGFIESPSTVKGVYHFPLLRLASKYGITGSVEPNLNIDNLINALGQDKVALLSVDINKLDKKLNGAHLILVYQYDEKSESFIVNDCAHILNHKGKQISVPKFLLNRICNNKGLTLHCPIKSIDS